MSVYELLTLFVIPALLMLFCYFRVIRELWASTRVITILTSASSGGRGGGGGRGTPTRQSPSTIRSYLVRWPTKKAGTVSVNCTGATPKTASPVPVPLPGVPKITRTGKSSVSSSGVSSSSTGKGTKGCPHLPPSSAEPDTEVCPPDSPMALAVDSSPSPSSAFCKLFACLHNWRTLWLRPCGSSKGRCCGKRAGGKCAKLSHRSHHRCRHHHHHSHQQHTHFKVADRCAAGGEHHCAHCHRQAHAHSNQQSGRVGVSYREAQASCAYKCTGPCQVEVSSSHGIDSEKESSVSHSSGTCATSQSSQRNTVLITSPSSPPPPPLAVTLGSPKGRQKGSSLLTCCFGCSPCSPTARAHGPQRPVAPQSPYDVRPSRQGGGACRASQRASYTLTSSFTNLHTSSTTATGASAYNMVANHGHAQGAVNGPSNGPTAGKAINLSVTSTMASQQVTSVTLQTPSTSTGAMPTMYRHSTASGYRAPVTDVRNARKQVPHKAALAPTNRLPFPSSCTVR